MQDRCLYIIIMLAIVLATDGCSASRPVARPAERQSQITSLQKVQADAETIRTFIISLAGVENCHVALSPTNAIVVIKLKPGSETGRNNINYIYNKIMTVTGLPRDRILIKKQR